MIAKKLVILTRNIRVQRPNILSLTSALRTSVADVICAGKKIIVLVMISLIFASCASVQKKDERSVHTVAELINQGDNAALFRMSEVPFLLDQEIILLKNDIETFWGNIIAAGYTVDSPILEDGQAITNDSYRRFYDSMEVKTFFKKYLTEKTRMLELRTSTDQRILLLVEKKLFTRKIYGFKGPY